MIEYGSWRDLCLAAGADDAAAVSLDHAGPAGEREHALEVTGGWRPPTNRSVPS